MPSAHGLITIPSRYSVPETVQKLRTAIESRNMTIFAFVDHSGEAEKIGMRLAPTQLLIFGSPKGGTPLMQAAPTLAIDLPLKALAWQDDSGKVWVSYNDPEYLQSRHNVPADLIKNIAGAGTLLQKALE
ncbi:MAG TPA: DUF302 domain-containing protein [Terriglobales bacterium]|nr:DUF302 domain-containing protein [Terriglobales bacterium]